MVMALGALLLSAAVVFYVLQPLVAGQFAPLERADEEMGEAEAERRVKLLALRDVEYDYLAGKLDEADYTSLKNELSAEAVKALDRAEGEAAGRGSADLEAEIATVRAALAEGRGCASCGHVNRTGSRFCSSCGSRLGSAPVGSGGSGDDAGE